MKTIITQLAMASILLFFFSCSSDQTQNTATEPAPKVEKKVEKPLSTNAQFFNKFNPYCGKMYSGKLLYSPDPGFFKGKNLNIKLEYCNDKEVSIQFAQGEDTSQKWKLTKNNDDLTFKLHISKDNGKPAKITNFGGTSTGGSASSQTFPADAATAKMIPKAKNNKWVLDMDEAGKKLTYTIFRGSKKHFSAAFDLAKPN